MREDRIKNGKIQPGLVISTVYKELFYRLPIY